MITISSAATRLMLDDLGPSRELDVGIGGEQGQPLELAPLERADRGLGSPYVESVAPGQASHLVALQQRGDGVARGILLGERLRHGIVQVSLGGKTNDTVGAVGQRARQHEHSNEHVCGQSTGHRSPPSGFRSVVKLAVWRGVSGDRQPG